MKQRYSFLFLILFFCYNFSNAQELKTRVQVLAPAVPNINKRNVEVLQNAIRDFLNNNKWSNETYTATERIECNFVITLTAWDGNSAYKAEAQIQSSRPVYNTAYNSTLLNISDKDFDFNYSEGQSLDFSDQNFISNLSSLLSFYAYTIIGLDKDSYSKLGGTPYYNKAQNVLNVAQVAGNKGWQAFDGLKNRYWLIENLKNKGFESLREFIYAYHLNGLDRLQEDPARGARKIINLLSDLKQLDKQKVGSIFPNMYLATKADELVNIISLTDQQEKIKAYNLLSEIDPANLNKYEALKTSR